MASQSWGQCIASLPVPGTLYNTYTTAKSMLTSTTATEASAAAVTLPPGFWHREGTQKLSSRARKKAAGLFASFEDRRDSAVK